MRHETQWLTDILEAANLIAEFVAGYSPETFVQDAKTRSAVLQQLTTIGEAAGHLSQQFRDEHSIIDWISAIRFRNRAVHAYFTINWMIVWDTATQNVPELALQIAEILAQPPSSE